MMGNQITRVVIELVSTLPVTNLNIGRIVYLTTDDKFYGYTSNGWKEVTPDMFPGYAYLDPANDNTKQITKWSEPSTTPDAEDDGAKAVDEHSHKDDYVTAAQVATTLRNLRRFDDPSIDNTKNHYGYPVYNVNGQLTSIDTTKIVADHQWNDLLKNRMMIPRIAANGSVVESPFFVDNGWYKLTTRDQWDTMIPTSGCVVENIKHMAEYILGVAYANLGNGIFATNSSGETIWISTTAGSAEEKLLSVTSNGVQVQLNVTTTVDSNSTDTQIPTAKAVYDNITSIKEDVDTKFDDIDVSNSIGNSENLANGDDVSYCRGFGNMKYTWDLPSGETEIGGSAFLDWNQIIFPVNPGETIYMNCVLANLTISYFDSEKEFVTTSTCMSDNFVVPSDDNIAYVGIPLKGCAMVGFVFSREPIGQDSGDIDALYTREIRQTDETEYTADYDGILSNSSDTGGYRRSRRFITTHQQGETNINKFTPNLYSRTAPDGTVSNYWWEACYMKRGNCDMSYGNWYQTAFAMLDTSTGIYSYGIYDPQLYKTSDTVKKIGEYYNGIDILAKTKSGEFLTLDVQTDAITQDLTFGLLVFRNNIGGELGAFSRAIANATDPNATHITNYGTLVNELTNQDGKFFRYKRVKKRIIDDYITYTREGDSEPFYKFSITEIKNIIDTNGTVDWNAFTQDELDNWEDGHKEIKYSGNDFDFNVSGIVLYNGIQQYQMQFIRSFVSIAPVKTRAYDAAMNNSSVAGSQWKGKKWYAYGTSMTDANYHGYVDRLTNVSGLTCKNFGLGGSGIIPSLHSSDNIKTRCMRTSDGKTEADLITIEIIPNDMSGTLGNSTDTGDTTFCGNLNQILQYLQANTTAQIVVLIATRSRYLYSNTSTKYPPTSSEVTKWMQWVSATEEVCKRNCVQCWDGSSQCGLGYYRVGGETTDTKYVKDQIHLTPLGAKNLADYFWSRLQNLPLFYSS